MRKIVFRLTANIDDEKILAFILLDNLNSDFDKEIKAKIVKPNTIELTIGRCYLAECNQNQVENLKIIEIL